MKVDVSQTQEVDLPEIAKITREVHPRFIADGLAAAAVRNIREGCCAHALSLTARVRGAIAGNVYFFQHDIFSRGRALKGVELAIVSVRKSLQKQGVGTALIRKAHEIARSSGYDVAVVNGWPEYYSHFGYRSAFGAPHLAVRPPQPGPGVSPSWRAVEAKDIPRIREIWEMGNAEAPLAIAPPTEFAFWQDRHAWAMEDARGSAIRGFVIVDAEKRHVHCFESEGRDASLEMLGHLAEEGYVDSRGLVDLPVHPSHRVAADLADCAENAVISRKDYLMACDFTGSLAGILEGAEQNHNMLGIYWTPRDEWVN